MPKTTISELQAFLDSLMLLAAADDRAAFVTAFVPLDLVGSEDEKGYLNDLMTEPDQWRNLAAEIMAMADGAATVDEKTAGVAVFAFEHPLVPDCDREVVFKLADGQWRAEG